MPAPQGPKATARSLEGATLTLAFTMSHLLTQLPPAWGPTLP